MSATRTPAGRVVPQAGGERGRAGRLDIAVLLMAAAMLLTWLGSGVAVSEVLRFVAFELFYVLAPGCLLYVVLSPNPGGRLRTLAIGWPLGYAMEVGAFALTAALGVRWALTLLPVVTLPIFGGLLFLTRSGRARLSALLRAAPPRAMPHFAPVAVAVTAAVVLLSFTFFASSPLPRNARSVSYSEDNVFDITLAGEARHHWPITESWIAGQPLHYYTGVFMHAAAVNQVMGVSLATLFLRLLPSMMFLIAALQLWALGGSLGRSRWIGPVAAVLLLVTQDINLDPTKSLVFLIDPFTQFPLSPSFAFGVPFFLGGLLLIQSRFVVPGSSQAMPRGELAGSLLMLAILVVGMTASKAFAGFDFVGGLGLYWLWRLVRGSKIGARREMDALHEAGSPRETSSPQEMGRPQAIGSARETSTFWEAVTLRESTSRRLVYCIVVAGVAALAIYFLMIAGGGSATLGLRPFNFIKEGDTLMRATKLAKEVLGPSLYLPALAGGSVVLAVCLLAPLLGAGWLIFRDRGASDSTAFLLAIFVVGLAAYVLLGAPAGVEGVFLIYGYVALVPVAAKGLVLLWSETPQLVRRRLLQACCALLVLGVTIAALTPSLGLKGTVRDAWLALTYGSVAGGIVLSVWKLQGGYTPRMRTRLVRIVACCIPLLIALALVKPIALAGSGAWKTIVGKPTSLADTSSEYGMTAPLYRGLLWVRAHTTSCNVLAVNNHYDTAARDASVYFYYSAFTERRIFLESWRYTADGQFGAQPYPTRFALNQRATVQGEPEALRELARRGVSYVLIDKTHGGGAAEPASVSRLLFSNSALDVYRLLPVGPPHACATVS
jgi:hypothetical protein